MGMPFHKAGKRSLGQGTLVLVGRDLLRLGRDEIA